MRRGHGGCAVIKAKCGSMKYKSVLHFCCVFFEHVFLFVSQRVMNEAYKIIVHTYIKLLIKIKLSKLQKCWSPNVGQTVAQDAEWLHETFSDLVRSTFSVTD